ncbi:hypothetical protein PENTCL1PPCAC_5742, partial [Pristionchus entomophagus]
SNPELPLPDWLSSRSHIDTTFLRLQTIFIPELTRATHTLLPFCPVSSTCNVDESVLELERRSHFISTGYFHAVCDAIIQSMPANGDNQKVVHIVDREIPRLRTLLKAIERIV